MRSDLPRIRKVIEAAYSPYVERTGVVPLPMSDNYAEVIARDQVTVAETDEEIVGVITLVVTDEGFLLNNVCVHPRYRGKKVGKLLLAFAEEEARRAGFDSIYLYTHEQVTENLALYSKIGYVEYDRRPQGNFSLVFMRKQLG